MSINDRFIPRDDNLKDYATERQWELLCAYWNHGSDRAAAKALGINESCIPHARAAVRRRAAKQGYAPEHQVDRPVPDGYKVKGVSALYWRGEEEPALQWVKTAEDRERQEELLRALIAGSRDDLTRAVPVKAPGTGRDDLMAVYPVGDHHFGMYAWHEEAGDNYDLDVAERLLSGAVDALTRSLPKADNAALVLLGDLLHYDNLEPLTPANKNLLDSDSRFGEVVRVVLRSVRRSVRTLLKRHQHVRVVVQAGNHDPSSSLVLAEALAAIYEDEPRLDVDTSPSQFHYFRHGKCLVGVCHGHEVKKLDQLPLLMATDRPTDWGETKHRYWLSGHVHHDRAADVQGVRVESFRVLPPTDAYAHNSGYRSARDMKGLVLHREHGEVQRVSVNPGMLE